MFIKYRTLRHNVKNTVFITFALRLYVEIFFENIFHVCMATTSTDKSAFKNLQFLVVAYDMGVLSCAFDVV